MALKSAYNESMINLTKEILKIEQFYNYRLLFFFACRNKASCDVCSNFPDIFWRKTLLNVALNKISDRFQSAGDCLFPRQFWWFPANTYVNKCNVLRKRGSSHTEHQLVYLWNDYDFRANYTNTKEQYHRKQRSIQPTKRINITKLQWHRFSVIKESWSR